MKKLVIIDGNAIIHRSYHAIPLMTTKDGTMVNAVYGFVSMLLKVWKDLNPEYLVVTFDMKGPTFRHEKYKEYKATRVKADQELYDQIPLTHKVVEAFNIPIFEKEGYEADDIIATIVDKVKRLKVKGESDGVEVVIVTGDMDAVQLVREGVKVYTLRKGMNDVVIYDEKAVENRYGFGPEMMVDYKALRGDPSDNIPGVPGIGEKTATELIQKIGGIEEIYKQVKGEREKAKGLVSESVIKKLLAGKESAEMSKELATMDANVPDLDFDLDQAELKDFDREQVVNFFQKMEFFSLLKRIPGATMEYEPTKILIKKNNISFEEIKDKKEVQELLKIIKRHGEFAIKIILSNPDIFSSEIIGLTVVSDNKGFYLRSEFVIDFFPIFKEERVILTGHNLKQLLKIFLLMQVPVKNKIFDIMIASYLLHSSSRSHDLGHIALKVLGKELPPGSSQMDLFGHDPKTDVLELNLISEIKAKLEKELFDTENLGLFEKVEMPLIFVLAKMELNGVAVDLEMLQKMSLQVKDDIVGLSEKIYKMAGVNFNISSPLQLREVLFEKMEIPVQGIKKGKTGLSTSAEQLEKLRGLHPIVEEIEKYRELSKLQNTYIDVLPTLIHKKTGRIHSSFNQAITATGRLSSSDPNLQNIPIRTEIGRKIRQAFVAEKGNLLMSVDYSQIELRIVASLAKDQTMMEIFARDEDIHTATASVINDVSLDKVTKDMRRSAKEINFGILYGMGAYGLSWRAEITRYEAQDFIKKYFEKFSGVKKYLDDTLSFAREKGYCETLFGRRRYIPELNSDNFQIRSSSERMAINHPVQGTAADLMKMAMIEIYLKLKGERTKPDKAKMILQVHDELVFELKKDDVEKIGTEIKNIMENVIKLNVPIKVEVKVGDNWGEMETL